MAEFASDESLFCEDDEALFGRDSPGSPAAGERRNRRRRAPTSADRAGVLARSAGLDPAVVALHTDPLRRVGALLRRHQQLAEQAALSLPPGFGRTVVESLPGAANYSGVDSAPSPAVQAYGQVRAAKSSSNVAASGSAVSILDSAPSPVVARGGQRRRLGTRARGGRPTALPAIRLNCGYNSAEATSNLEQKTRRELSTEDEGVNCKRVRVGADMVPLPVKVYRPSPYSAGGIWSRLRQRSLRYSQAAAK